MEKTNNLVSWFTKIGFKLSFDEKTLTGGRVYENIINNIADRHINGEIKNLEFCLDDLEPKNKIIRNKLFQDVYNNILNDPEKSKRFFENIVENITNDKYNDKYNFSNNFLINHYLILERNLKSLDKVYHMHKYQKNYELTDKYSEGILNQLIKLNDNKEYDKVNKLMNNWDTKNLSISKNKDYNYLNELDYNYLNELNNYLNKLNDNIVRQELELRKNQYTIHSFFVKDMVEKKDVKGLMNFVNNFEEGYFDTLNYYDNRDYSKQDLFSDIKSMLKDIKKLSKNSESDNDLDIKSMLKDIKKLAKNSESDNDLEFNR